MIKRKPADIKNNSSILAPTLAIFLSTALLAAAPVYEDYFGGIIGIPGFLSLHNLLEIAGVIAYFAIFLVSFYTYRQEHFVKAIVVGSLLMSSGIMDVFHLLSYKGMPDFFVPNIEANRATTFWIAARLISTAAYMASAVMHNDTKSKVSEYWFPVASIVLSFVVFDIATYFPEFLPAMYIEGVGLTYEKKLLEYFIIAVTAVAAIIYIHKYIKTKNPILYIMFSALTLSVMSEFTFTMYVDIYGVCNFLGHVLKCISLFMVFRVTFSKYVLTPYTALAAAQDELRDYADNLDRLVEKRTRELKMINDILIEDLDYARDIQKSMMPSFFPNSPHISFRVLYMPAERLSGDFYDVYWLDEDHIGFYVCDVSGHGVPAAMLTVFLKQCIDSFIEADRLKGTLSSPSEMLGQIYDAFNHTNFRDEVYIVLIYFIFDIRTKKLTFSSAGMNEAPMLLSGQGKLADIDITGFPICKLNDVYKAAYEDMELMACPGDRLIIYTDGLIELKNDKSEQYSSGRLKQLISENSQMDSEHLISAIRQDLRQYEGDREPEDDITLMCVEFR
jgi:sigma-B regulation protein RsbU (phosphoserine phosphatase)